MRIAYQGVAGAYSHIASMTVYPGQEYLPCDTFEKAMNLVSEGEADLAMIPVENSNAGRVSDVHFLLSFCKIDCCFNPLGVHLWSWSNRWTR